MTKIAKMIWKEACGRKVSFLLSALAMTVAVALCTTIALTEDASRRETKRVMRDLGFNLRVIPQSTNMNRFYLSGYSDQTMPEQSLDTLAKVKNLSYNHLVGVLQGSISMEGEDALLMGISEERAPPGGKKPPMVKVLKPGSVHVGAEIASRLNLTKGDTILLSDQEFRVERCMPEMGTIDDLRVVGSLADVQNVLNLPEQINEIKALDCLCLTPAENPKDILQKEIGRTLPETRVVMVSNIAEARARQRQTSQRYSQFLIAAVLLAAATGVAAIAIANVRQRSSEMGLLRALGYGSNSIVALILGRSLLTGVLAALLGTALGTWIALTYGPQLFQVTARAIKPQPQLYGYALLGTLAFATVAGIVPAALAVVQDPATVLRKQ